MMLESDLRVEYEVDAKLREVIALCETEKDYVTRDMLIVLLDDTEMDHAHWLEQQLGLIKRLGILFCLFTPLSLGRVLLLLRQLLLCNKIQIAGTFFIFKI